MNKIWDLPVFLVPLSVFLIFSLEAFMPREHNQTGENCIDDLSRYDKLATIKEAAEKIYADTKY